MSEAEKYREKLNIERKEMMEKKKSQNLKKQEEFLNQEEVEGTTWQKVLNYVELKKDEEN